MFRDQGLGCQYIESYARLSKDELNDNYPFADLAKVEIDHFEVLVNLRVMINNC